MIIDQGPGLVKVDYGPTQMTIFASCDQQPMEAAVTKAANYGIEILDKLAQYKHIAKKPQSEIVDSDEYPAVLQKMIASVKQSGDSTLTPMAAVAGSIADMVADYLQAMGATKTFVNNGGDIAVRLQGKETLTVGLAPVIGGNYTHLLKIGAGDGVGGITTSGLGGRSFTKGIATAVTVTAPTAAFADACATSIANSVYTPHANIKLDYAGNIDPDSDIADHLIVCEVTDLPPDVIQEALLNGYHHAQKLYAGKLITGAVLFYYNWGIMLPENFISPVADVKIEEGLSWKI